MRSASTAGRGGTREKTMAVEGAIFLKIKNPSAEVTVRDVESGETIVVKHPTSK